MRVLRRRLAGLLVACLTLAACGRMGVSVPQSPLLKYVERKSGIIAYASDDGNIALIDQTGADQRALTTDALLQDEEGATETSPFVYYEMPIWSPDGSRVACVRLAGTGEYIEEARIVILPVGRGEVVSFTTEGRIPDLLAWSPDSARLVFLASSESGSSYGFYLVSASGGEPVLLDAGYPYGFAWSPRSQELVVHAGSVSGGLASNRLAFLDVEHEVLEEGLGLAAGVFDVPAWSPDGRTVLVATWEQGKNRLFATNRKRSEGEALVEVEGSLVFAFSPTGDRVAYAAASQDASGFTSALYVISSSARLDDSPRPKAKLLSGKDLVAAFSWSPDGSRIAYFVPGVISGEDEDAGEALVLTLKVVDAARGPVREVTTFLPTPDFLDVVEQYAQYAQGLRIWSPDSRHIVYAAVGEEGPDIMVAMAGESIAPRSIASGLSAAWSRR